MEIKGVQGSIRFDGEWITIVKRAVGSQPREFRLRAADVTGTRLKPATRLFHGYVQLVLPGSAPRRRVEWTPVGRAPAALGSAQPLDPAPQQRRCSQAGRSGRASPHRLASDPVRSELNRARSAGEWGLPPVARLSGDLAHLPADTDPVRREEVRASRRVHSPSDDDGVPSLLLFASHLRSLGPRRHYAAGDRGFRQGAGDRLPSGVPSRRGPAAQPHHRLPVGVRGGHYTHPQPGSYSCPGP